MDLKKIIDKKEQAAQYMVDEITHICNTFEKRGPGEYGEKQACEYCAEEMKKLGCDRVYVEGFKENPGSFFGWINFTITFCFIAFASYFFMPELSIVLSLSVFLFVCFSSVFTKRLLISSFPKRPATMPPASKSPQARLSAESSLTVILMLHGNGPSSTSLNTLALIFI